MRRLALSYGAMRRMPVFFSVLFWTVGAQAQIQVDLKLPRLQFISYEPVIATVGITNLSGRDIELQDIGSQAWFGFEVTRAEGQPIVPVKVNTSQPPLKIETGKRVTQKINLTPLYPVQDFGVYHVRAHIYFSDLSKYFYSQAKVFEVSDARPIWQKTVGIPEGTSAPGSVRTYSLLSNRFPNHTSLYVRVEDKDSGIVYSTFSLGRILSLEEPQAEIDQANRLHILHCAAPRNWSYAEVGLNGELVRHSTFLETRTRPRLGRNAEGTVVVHGGMVETRRAEAVGSTSTAPKLSDRPPELPKGD